MSKKTTTITMVVVALLTLAIVATVIIFAVKNGRQPENPVEPSTDITSSTEKPDDNIVDPRYDLVRNSYGEKTLNRWQDLNGRWAVPGVGYGQSILNDYYKGIINS